MWWPRRTISPNGCWTGSPRQRLVGPLDRRSLRRRLLRLHPSHGRGARIAGSGFHPDLIRSSSGYPPWPRPPDPPTADHRIAGPAETAASGAPGLPECLDCRSGSLDRPTADHRTGRPDPRITGSARQLKSIGIILLRFPPQKPVRVRGRYTRRLQSTLGYSQS
jgi:hypothetical protein